MNEDLTTITIYEVTGDDGQAGVREVQMLSGKPGTVWAGTVLPPADEISLRNADAISLAVAADGFVRHGAAYATTRERALEVFIEYHRSLAYEHNCYAEAAESLLYDPKEGR